VLDLSQSLYKLDQYYMLTHKIQYNLLIDVVPDQI